MTHGTGTEMRAKPESMPVADPAKPEAAPVTEPSEPEKMPSGSKPPVFICLFHPTFRFKLSVRVYSRVCFVLV